MTARAAPEIERPVIDLAYGAAPAAPRATQAPPVTRLPVAADRSDGSESQVRATTVAQERRTPKPAPAERQSAQSPPKRADAPQACLPNNPRPRHADAPAGTKEGDTRLLSVADRRLDEPQKNPKPVAARHKAPQRTAEGAGEDFDDWRPAARHQDPTETASPSREIDR